ncbi:MBL fold metallo-hydrolase [Achromobacter sp.]|uniref:MBL fold metallo-hydrolase n=1 Tax=Achromobacter sp. TaxID=134375 RepID=UPI0028B1230B|nr:MBL fold metallo-hydrolase [Achromobacter sp.]
MNQTTTTMIMKLRSRSLQAALVIALGTAGFAQPLPVQAAAPMVKTQAPGFYRMMLGAFEITALSDGTVDLPAEALLHAPASDVARHLREHHQNSPVETSINAYLVNTGAKLVLIDTGTGSLMGPELGKLEASLRAAGYQPEQVDEILLTHAHPDHVGGLTAGGKRVFANAIIRIEQDEASYWMSPERMGKAQEMARGFFEGAIASLTPYADAGRIAPFRAGAQLLPGISAITAHGHTVGHTVYAVESQGQRMLVIGDLIHVGAVQLQNPQVTIAFDMDEKAAAATRLKFFSDAARSGELIAASHLSFPGIGRLIKTGESFRWEPVSYTTQFTSATP